MQKLLTIGVRVCVSIAAWVECFHGIGSGSNEETDDAFWTVSTRAFQLHDNADDTSLPYFVVSGHIHQGEHRILKRGTGGGSPALTVGHLLKKSKCLDVVRVMLPAHAHFLNTRKFTRRVGKRRCVLFAAGWREPGVVCYHI